MKWVCLCSCERGIIWRRTVSCVYGFLKHHVFCLEIVYYLLLQLSFVQGCIFGRSYSLPMLLLAWLRMFHFWFGTIPVKILPNEIWQSCVVIFIYMLKSILMPSLPIFKMTSCQIPLNVSLLLSFLFLSPLNFLPV